VTTAESPAFAYGAPGPAARPADLLDHYAELVSAAPGIEAASAWADGLAAGARAAFPSAFERAVSRFHARFIEDMIDFVVARGS
jgi:hypothetical protein